MQSFLKAILSGGFSVAKLSLILLGTSIVHYVYAATGVGEVASNLMTPVTTFSDFMNTACLLIGVCFLFAGILKYFEHKRSPLMVSLSTVIFLIVCGSLLLLFPLMAYYTSSGIHYSLYEHLK